MPIFQFKCDKCDKLDDKLISRSDADNNVDFDCDCAKKGKLKRTNDITAAALRFKGNWSGTTGSF